MPRADHNHASVYLPGRGHQPEPLGERLQRLDSHASTYRRGEAPRLVGRSAIGPAKIDPNIEVAALVDSGNMWILI